MQHQRKNLQKLETKRHLLSQQSSLIAEAETLNTALASHSLNSLSQRYNIFKRARNEYKSCKQTLNDHSSAWANKMTNYLGCLDSMQCQKMHEYMNQITDILGALQIHPVTHEFDMIREFLENSAQTAIYVQSSQMANEMHAMMMQQTRVIQHAIEQLDQYGAVIQYQPPSTRVQHRIAKYSEWCQYLIEHDTIQDCHEIVNQFQGTIGKNAIEKVSLQQIVSFSCQLQTNIHDGQFKLQKFIEQLRKESERDIDIDANKTIQIYHDRYHDAKTNNLTFIRENAIANSIAMKLVAAKNLCVLNNRLLLMENAAASSADNLVDLTFDGNWYLDEMYTNCSISIDLCEAFEMAHSINNSAMTMVMHELQKVFRQLKSSNETFRSLLGDFIQAVIGEDREVLDMITILSSLQDGLQTIPEMLSNLSIQLRNKTNNGNENLNDVQELKRRLNAMRTQFNVTNDANRGRKLFIIFDNIFDAIHKKHQGLIEHCKNINIPIQWKRINHVKDSINLAVS